MLYDGEGGSWPEIAPPILIGPAAGSTVSLVLGWLLQVAPFVSSTDALVGTQFEIRSAPDGGGTLIWSSGNDPLSILTKGVPGLLSGLAAGQTFYVRARFTGNLNVSGWSADLRLVASL